MSESIRAYINRAPEAISGQGGHNTTFRIARTLYNGFALSADEVIEWLRVYNSRLSEKWTDAELNHKADSAERARYDKPRGWMLNEKQTPQRKVAIKTPKNTNFGIKSVKKYVLATDATDISYT